MKDVVLPQALKLKNWTGVDDLGNMIKDGDDVKPEYFGNGQIYLSHDEIPYQRKENFRLRKLRNTLRAEDKERKKKIIMQTFSR